MMHSLKPFGVSERFKLNFAITRDSSGFDFHFALIGRSPADLATVRTTRLLPNDQRERRDGLWSSTCFEIFYGPAGQPHYTEVNLAPSGDWNVYAFNDYRTGMRPVEHATATLVSHESSPLVDHHVWHARVEDQTIAGEVSLVLGATAVIEYENGEREYWALAHAGAKPDFHLRESFRILL